MAFTYDNYKGTSTGKGGLIADGGQGPLHAAIYGDPAVQTLLSPFKKRERNLIVRLSLIAAGMFWVRTFLPMRFTDYARKLGYRASSQWEQVKRQLTGMVLPLVGVGDYRKGKTSYPPGTMRLNAINGAKVEATGIAGKETIRIKMPLGHPVQVKSTAVLHTVPPWEMERIGQELQKSLLDYLKNVKPGDATTGAASLLPDRAAPATFDRPAAHGLTRQRAG